MLTVMSLIQTRTELTDRHVTDNAEAMRQAVAGVPGGGLFNRVIDRSQKGISYARGALDLDAIGQAEFPDISASMTAASSGAFNLSMGLPGPLVEAVHPIVCLRNTVIAPPKAGLKRMSILRKRPDVSCEVFQDQWFNVHSFLVKRLPGITGYRQNLVLDGPRDEVGHMMVDGMVELWFPDGATIDAAFGSDIGRTTMTHALEFIAEISTFLVEPVALPGQG
ncbi:EthD domain-containing protein [Mesobacterium pallidum]|uniref:EthD domain-containing protein n=1 Tax=Mesobacterium pallidum TaxID=2872037 RepID=UPI001EE1892A|nr:EthD domain-containing protein [Mesobacterium pallidum]